MLGVGLGADGWGDVALANADGMLKKIMTAADTNEDGKITYDGGCFPRQPGLAALGVLSADA